MRTAEERFNAKWGLEPDSNCWLWTASTIKSRGGSKYGVFTFGSPGQTGLAHRFSHEHFKGFIPKGLEIDHLCRNTLCVNPDHLEAVTHSENQRRGNSGSTMAEIHRKKTVCPHGHPYNEANTYVDPKGSRQCRTCRRITWKASYRKRGHFARYK